MTTAICPEIGCPTLTRGGRCPRHRRSAGRRPRRRRPTKSAGPKPKRGDYGATWKRIRARVLSESSVCEACGARATQVDHIIPQSRGGTHARANLRPLCARCHAIKTNTIDRPLARRRRQVAR